MTGKALPNTFDRPVGQRFTGPDHLVDYICGNCEIALLHTMDDLRQNLLIVCTECGAHNSTDAPADERRIGHACPPASIVK